MTLANVTGVSNISIGLIVGTIFFVCICLDSFSISSIARRFNLKNPSALGTAMILFGLLYLLSPLIIPAYLQAQTLPNSGFSINLRDTALSFSLMSLLITLGFVRDRYRGLKYKGGKKTKWTYHRE
jgi:predicted transporter